MAQIPPLKVEGYKGFGSFHSDSLSQLLQQGITPFPAKIEAAFSSSISSSPLFSSLSSSNDEGESASGEGVFFTAACKSDFLLDPAFAFLNHGAFGSPLRCLLDVANAWREHVEKQPLLFIDRQLFPFLARTMIELGQYLGVPAASIALTQNVTTGLNAAIFSYAREVKEREGRGPKLGTLDIAYGAVKKMISVAAEENGGEAVTLPVGSSFHDKAHFLTVLEEELTKVETCDVFVFDAVTSNTALLLPVREVCEVLRRNGVKKIIVDGAHALGQIPFGVEEGCERLDNIDFDVFAFNCHKWMCVPRGCAFLVAPSPMKGEGAAPPTLRGRVVSHGTAEGWQESLLWDGARDYSPSLTLPFALRLWQSERMKSAVGAMRRYATEQAEAMARRWQTHILSPLDMRGAMLCVALPSIPALPLPLSSSSAKAVQDWLFDQNIECPVKCIDGKLYLRLSFHVHCTGADVERLTSAIDALLRLPPIRDV
eukprot:CAMPEP_0113906594 /NCGR_PEP_ID=MMETSP0780_2-20120614/24874_1 /TAXON_ID=652834 /ORGANISM="Palpitomonas bilix" /LENGTH=483 /DNA_ID=CAMNT_0000901291 /DNA_START=104 /DNA_END=1555 /DNA_ORIENTATION=+ /assembly_acc=CAM_ASM_000599